ncbi:Uncharacterized protein OBRU01_12446 [Operophtera brumata]|uniref:Uncharacterized protein n=1 Tax=Operophtera brumata TaxID=104452 RepID=A0A0L7LA65_OPEBR|nr:Uncharacterized protein OBRU01_12446 [Operophtera brumata]
MHQLDNLARETQLVRKDAPARQPGPGDAARQEGTHRHRTHQLDNLARETQLIKKLGFATGRTSSTT